MTSSEDIILLDRGNGTCAKVHLYGATLISWHADGEERLFVSSKSHYDKKKAIRGGVPLVFPQFGAWDCGPQHGFARIQMWTLSSAPQKNSDGDVTATFTLADNEDTRKMWNYKFQLSYTVTVKENRLWTSLKVENTGSETFTFTCLLHTYLKVPDVSKVKVTGLKGSAFSDKVKNVDGTEEREEITIHENVDCIYMKTPDTHVIHGTMGNSLVSIHKENLPDTVVWNPWAEKAAAMSDFGDNEYPNMLCVEAGYVGERMELAPGKDFTGSQTVSL